MVVTDSDVPWERRSASWETTELPVPADLVVLHARAEWQRRDPDSRFTRTLDDETRWVFVRST